MSETNRRPAAVDPGNPAVDGTLVRRSGARADVVTDAPGGNIAQVPWVVRPRSGLRCGAGTYVLNAAVHPASVFVIMTSALMLVIHPSIAALPIALLVDVVFLAGLSRCGFFQRAVHVAIEQQNRAANRHARDVLVLQMAEAHRNELARIEAIIEDALANAQRRGVLVGTREAMARLTLSYIHLAVDHRACAQSLAMTDPEALQATIGSLEAAVAAQPAPASSILGRRLAIARRRADRWAEARATVETIRCQLATLTELAYLVHQEACMVPSSTLPADVDRVLAEFEHGDHAAREIASMGLSVVVDMRAGDADLAV